jgi:IPT/TIG domain/PASTA domain
MPTTQVTAGDLITAELMNEILARLANHDALLGQFGGAGTGTVTVPSLFGRSLSNAQATLTSPAQQLNLGSVIDADGVIINPAAQGAGARTVVGQNPPAGTRAAPLTSVDLLVSASGSAGGPSVPVLPIINQIVPTSAAVNSQITIFGANFAASPAGNTVRFNNVPGVVSALSNSQQLFVTVPPGIPNAPSAPGNPALNGVEVSVTSSGNTTATPGTISVTAPVPSQPTVTATVPAPPSLVVVNNTITITGTNFSATQAQNSVTIGGVNAPIVNSNTTQIVATAPLVSGLPSVGSIRTNVPLIVTVNGTSSLPFLINMTRTS